VEEGDDNTRVEEVVDDGEVEKEEEVDNEMTDDKAIPEDDFKPGNIHKAEFFNYWRDELEATPWVLNLLEKGYKIPFKSFPDEYEEKNNALNQSQANEFRRKIYEILEKSGWQVSKEKSDKEDGSMKYRLVFDASRCVNLFLEEKHVSLMHLEKSLEMTEKDEYQSIFDLTSCYYLHSTRVKQMNLEGRFMKYWKNL